MSSAHRLDPPLDLRIDSSPAQIAAMNRMLGETARVELRVVLFMIAPLLAEFIQRVAAPRLEAAGVRLSIVAAIDESADIAARLNDLAPDAIIATEAGARCLASGQSGLLTLSVDLSRIFGPKPHDMALLTAESLSARLLELFEQPSG